MHWKLPKTWKRERERERGHLISFANHSSSNANYYRNLGALSVINIQFWVKLVLVLWYIDQNNFGRAKMGYWYLIFVPFLFGFLGIHNAISNQKNKIKGLKIENTSFWVSCLLMFGHCSDWKICVVKFGKLVCPKLMMFEWLEQFVRWKGGLVSKSDNGEGIEAGAVGAW